MLDGVFNHTGKNSKYFKARESEYKDWYTFRDDGTYDCWWGVGDLPAVNKNSKSYLDFIADGPGFRRALLEQKGHFGLAA